MRRLAAAVVICRCRRASLLFRRSGRAPNVARNVVCACAMKWVGKIDKTRLIPRPISHRSSTSRCRDGAAQLADLAPSATHTRLRRRTASSLFAYQHGPPSRSRRLRRGLHGPAPHGRARHVARRVEAGAPRRQAREPLHGGHRVRGGVVLHGAPAHGPPVVRRRAALQRRLQPARGLHGRGDLRLRRQLHGAAFRPHVLAARRLRHGRRGRRRRREDPPEAGQLAGRDDGGHVQVRAGQAPRVQELLRHVEPRAPGHADGRHGARQVLPRRQARRPQQARARVPVRDARGGARALARRRRHRRLPVPQPRAPRPLRALHARARRAER
mmetsp:Transcript_1627/g.5439  ORF Transcript_1627/g.5439 Transcript_1627/m.5439 type:complete len:328 (-) Transcript_1627:638-1621(-)